MPTTPRSQSQLSRDGSFLNRLSGLLLSEAGVIAAEPSTVPNHAKRRELAQLILMNPTAMTANLAPAICNATNLVAANTAWDFEAGSCDTDASDAAIRSQISTMWDVLAGV
jgi:hypothetical protein